MQSQGLYEDIVQSTYIANTHAFYTKESDKLASNNSMSAKDFLAHAQARSKEELERAQEVLLPESVAIVHDTTDNALLAGRLQWLAKDGERYRYPCQGRLLMMFSSGITYVGAQRRAAQEDVQAVCQSGWAQSSQCCIQALCPGKCNRHAHTQPSA